MTRPLPAFADVQQVMDKAAERPSGLRYRLHTYGAAVNFRQRCYKFRVKQQEHMKESYGMVPGYLPTTPYDDLEIAIESPSGERLKRRPTEHFKFYDVVFRHREPQGLMLDVETQEEINSEVDLDSSRSLDLE